MIKVVRKEKETVISLLKRFSKKIQQSGKLVQFKAVQFKERNKSDLKKKKEALMRIKKEEKLRKLYKLGKIDFPSLSSSG